MARSKSIINEPALSQDNIIEEGIKRSPILPMTSGIPSPALSSANDETFIASKNDTYPDEIAKRFFQIDNKFHFPDKSLAFTDHGKKLVTKHNNTDLIRSLISIAEIRGWQQITVKGTKEFRKTAWFQALLLGIEVNGYKPTKIEIAHLKSQIVKKTSISNSIEKGGITSINLNKNAVDDNKTQNKASFQQANNATKIQQDYFTGILIEHGSDNYLLNKNNEKSYFVKIRTNNDEKIIWGVTLASAIKSAGVKIGESIIINKNNHDPITVSRKTKDAKGQPITTAIPTIRNNWSIVPEDKPQAFIKEEREKVIEKYPDLAPAYATIAAAKKLAENNGWNKDQVERFVNLAKENLAAKIAHGDRIPSPNIRIKVAEQTQQQITVKQYEQEKAL